MAFWDIYSEKSPKLERNSPEHPAKIEKDLKAEFQEIMPKSEIFISYAWGGESEEIANALESTFQKKGIKIVRDKTDLNYKGLIREFMQQIGEGKCVITVISDKYLKSNSGRDH